MKFVIRDSIDQDTQHELNNFIGSTTEVLVMLAVRAGGRNVTRGTRTWFCAPCSYCGNWFRLKFLNRDHVIPVSEGGVNEVENIVLSCILCNQIRCSAYLHQRLSQGRKPLLVEQFQSFII